MVNKIRAPRLRSVLLGMLIMIGLLFYLFHRDNQRSVASSKATGLGSVATGWDPVSLWKQDSFASKVRRVTTGGIVGGVAGGVPASAVSDKRVRAVAMSTYLSAEPVPEQQPKKIVRSVTLELLVRDARQAASQIQQIATANNGEIEKAEVRNYAETSQSGELSLRVPSAQLETVVASFRKLALRVQNERWESRDITREYMDSEARLRNMKAEEQQYLVLLRRAGSMKDTLEVTEKLSEIRGEIEQLQGELNWWSHQVEMSAIHVSLTEEPHALVASRWRPLYNAKNAAQQMFQGLGEWVDWAVAFVISLPLILLWVGSIGGLLWVAWRFLRWAWVRWFKPAPQPVAIS